MNKPKIFKVTGTPKNADNILSLKPELASQYYSAIINVSDSPCATFDYQKAGLPSFWFPINEIEFWGHSPFYGAIKVVNEYYKNDKPVLLHCHAGANRSPSIAFAILLAKGYSVTEAEESLDYPNISKVFSRNIERKHIPRNIIDFLVEANKNETTSLHYCLRRLDVIYKKQSQDKFDQQNNYVLKTDSQEGTYRLVYDSDKKKFVMIKATL